jgi:hypothetical protein
LCPQNERNLSRAAADAEGREWISPPPRDKFCIKDSLENSIKVLLLINDRTSFEPYQIMIQMLTICFDSRRTFNSWWNGVQESFIE